MKKKMREYQEIYKKILVMNKKKFFKEYQKNNREKMKKILLAESPSDSVRSIIFI